MRALIRRTYLNINFTKLLEWGKLVTLVGSAQVIVQGLGFISGILILRRLPTNEYALYTLANTILGAMTVLADGGIAIGVMSQGGKVWQEKKLLGAVISTGLVLRRKFAIGSLIVAMPILIVLLRRHDATWLMTGLIILSIIPAFTMALSGELLEIAPKLNQDIPPLQKISVAFNVQRLALLTLTLFIFPWAFVAVLAAGIPQFWVNLRLRKVTARYADREQKPDPVVQKVILSQVKRLLPGSIYFCLSGQITIWLISIFGTTKAVAQVGALGRLSMMLTVVSILFGTLVYPRFARLPKISKVVLGKYVQILIGLFALCGAIVGLVALFPSQVLWILGKSYSDLQSEIVLSVTGSCLALIAGIVYSLYANRGWAMNPIFIIPFNIGVIVLGALILDISTLRGIFTFNIFVSTIEIIVTVGYTLIKIFRLKEA